MQRGFTVIEMLVAIVIVILLASFLSGLFGSYLKRNALTNAEQMIRSLLQQARSSSLSSKNASSFGVYFASSTITLFQGTTYASGDANNIVTSIAPYVSVSALNLGGVSQVVFDRLKGSADKTGTIEVSLTASSSQKKTITIYGTGVVQ